MQLKEKNKFSIRQRIKSSTHAWRGIRILFKTTHNAWLQVFFGALALYLGFILHLSNIEWVLIIFTIGLVLTTEALNTAFEIDIDLTSPEYHPYAKDTKDVAAGAVLISVILSIIVALIIFLPKIL
jgi:diacylglycerol kinase